VRRGRSHVRTITRSPANGLAIQLADLYHDPYSARRALDLSWAHAQAELRELGITPADAALYQELAGHLLGRIAVDKKADLVIDEFLSGRVERISREAPVLILKHRERSVVPGGGANAVCNLADLGVNVLPVGVVGDDEPGRLLIKAFRHKHVAVSGVLM
jgi:hypothetical protein